MIKIEDFDYDLPKNLIAHSPASPRDSSRLMVVDRSQESISHQTFRDLTEILTENDVLVFNETKVFPARIFGEKETGGKVEILLLKDLGNDIWEGITKPGLRVIETANLPKGATAQVKSKHENGLTTLRLHLEGASLEEIGITPLPPYIKSNFPEQEIRERYQTVYAKTTGSAAAPTAGLHFTPELLDKLIKKGVQQENIILHVGLGTFRPPTQEQMQSKTLHSEYFEITQETVDRLNKAKKQGKRIVSVGTTTTRVLETCSDTSGKLIAKSGNTEIFIYPPYKFRLVDGLITNFHLSKSSLLMLVSAFVSKPNTIREFRVFRDTIVGRAYAEAVEKKYRFYSFGDAMFIS